MIKNGSSAYRRSRSSSALPIAIALVGAALLIWGFVSSSFWTGLIGAVLLAFGLGNAIEPLVLTDSEGITIKRGGFLAMDKLIRWTSVRDLKRPDASKLLVQLPDHSWVGIDLGSLSEEDRSRLLSEIETHAIMASKHTELTA